MTSISPETTAYLATLLDYVADHGADDHTRAVCRDNAAHLRTSLTSKKPGRKTNNRWQIAGVYLMAAHAAPVGQQRKTGIAAVRNNPEWSSLTEATILRYSRKFPIAKYA